MEEMARLEREEKSKGKKRTNRAKISVLNLNPIYLKKPSRAKIMGNNENPLAKSFLNENLLQMVLC